MRQALWPPRASHSMRHSTNVTPYFYASAFIAAIDLIDPSSLEQTLARTCCLAPRLVIKVKFMVSCPSAVVAPPPTSSGRFLRAAGGITAESHIARAVFLSTRRDSADVSVTSLASSFANSASASSEGPRFSWRLLLADRTTGSSGEGGRSSDYR